MTISNTKAKSVYETNGERREWEIGFDFDSNVSKLNIILEDREGYQTVVEDNYLIEDGVVIYPSLESELDPIAEGYKIILFRETPNTQDIDLRDNVTEKGLDKLTLQVQELSEQVDRAVKVPLVEEGVNEYQDLVLKVREERDTALEQIKEATSVVSDYTQASALNAVTSREEADRSVEASNTSIMASADAEAFAIKAENLANEAHNAVSAYVNGLGAMRNAVLDLGVFEENQRRASSSIIDFDFEPLDVFVRFSDSENKMWIKGSHSFAGIEKVGDKKYKIFYSISSEDFASQSAIKGPFYVQYVIKYSIFSGKPVVYRGRVDSVYQLPENAEDGDLWYVGPVDQDNKEEYIWQGGKWELLGSTDFTNIYTKEEIDNKVKVIEADIDANADAIQKTRSDFMESDSELQQQINAHATEITTLKNDTDELGDQVAEIESKIPEGTSDTNPLVNKQQLSDAIQGGGSVPKNVYTEDNLVGGKDIEIVKKSGGIDDNTLACWHFEGTINDEVNETPANSNSATLATDYAKFGTGSVNGNVTHNAITKDANSPISFDFWALVPVPGISSYAQFILDTSDPAYAKKWMYVMGIAGSKLTVSLMGGATVTTDFTVPKGEWVHYYGHYIPETQTSEFFANGKKIFSQQNANYPGITKFYLEKSGVSRFDEVRISKAIRWTEDFTPPDSPYEAGSAGSVINFIGEAGGAGASFPLFYHTFADHLLNDASWLRGDTFSWQSGDMYVSAYNHLAEDLEGITAETETIGSTTITFYRAKDGHKIVLADQEDNVSAIYRDTGVAWYYILDTENKRFKLPRTKHNFAGIRTGVGNFVEAGLPNITGSSGTINYTTLHTTLAAEATGALRQKEGSNAQEGGSNTVKGAKIEFDASLSNSIYGNSDTVQPPATEQYLYFYVGNYVRLTAEVDTGALTELVNNFDITVLSQQVNEVKQAAIDEVLGAGEALSSYQQPLVRISETSGTIALEVNKIYTMEISGVTIFSLPKTVNTAFFNQIKVMAKVNDNPVINFGTSFFMNKSAPELEAGCYDFYFDWDNHLAGWVVGAIVKGA